MNLTRQSNVEKSLRGTPDSLLHNSITPPFLIKKTDGSESTEEKVIEEVLVDLQEQAPQEHEPQEEEQQDAQEGKKLEGEKQTGEVKENTDTKKAVEQ